MNNDPDYTQIQPVLKKYGLTWPQATMSSIEQLQTRYRIHSFPTTLLVGPDGKIISLGQTRKKQAGLRGQALLTSLDELLPPKPAAFQISDFRFQIGALHPIFILQSTIFNSLILLAISVSTCLD